MAIQAQGTVNVNGTPTCMGRIANYLGEVIARADIASIVYTIYALASPPSRATRTAVTGHTGVAVTVADAMPASLAVPTAWTEDAIGCNFIHTIPIDTTAAFTDPLTQYVVEYTLTPTSGQKIIASFLISTLH
jgi:hypothetical protein